MRFALSLAVMALYLTGCSSSASHPVSSPDVLRWGIVGTSDVPTLDPALASDPTSISVSSLIYGGLVRLDAHLRVRADGARSWTISRDGLVYTFHLRPDLRFADGRRVTAADFAGALNRALGPQGSSGTAPLYLSLITQHRSISHGATSVTRGVTVVDPETVRITLVHPAAHFLAELAFPAAYVPDSRLYSRYGDTWTDRASGFGPYVVRSWNHTQSLVLTRNPYYVGDRARFKRVILRFYSERRGIAAYRRKELDLLTGFQPAEKLPSGLAGIDRVPGLALDYLAFNTAKVPFHRLNARRAFAAAWKSSLSTEAMTTSVFPAGAFLPPGFGVSAPLWSPAATGAVYLKGARYRHGGEVPTITFVVPRDPGLQVEAQVLADRWRSSLGVDVIPRELNASNYAKVLAAHAFDLAIVRWGADYPDAQDFLGTQLGSSPDNVTGWKSRRFDDALFRADSFNPNDARRTAFFRQAAAIAAAKVPILPLDEPAVVALIQPGVKGVTLTALDTISTS